MRLDADISGRAEDVFDLHGPVWIRPQLDQSVQGDMDVRNLFQRRVCKVTDDCAEHSLMRHDADALFLPLHLDDDWLKPLDDIKVGLPTWIAVPQLVLGSHRELWEGHNRKVNEHTRDEKGREGFEGMRKRERA